MFYYGTYYLYSMNTDRQILKIYEGINRNKKLINEVTDTYDNVDFVDKGNAMPSKDNINTALLSDVQTAARNAGVKVDVTTAISGHHTQNSRHPSGNAVDIAVINGVSVKDPKIRSTVDKFVGELIKLGYTKNSEGSSNPKSVLTFGFPGHDNHVHVSNMTKTSSSSSASENAYAAAAGKSSTQSSDVTSHDAAGYAPVVGNVTSVQGITEQEMFGKDIKNRYGRVIIPGDKNPKIKSPISGKINNKKYFHNCNNQITIENNDNGTIYLQFCGISNPKVRDGQTISAGDVLGTTDSDVEVNMYDKSWSTVFIPQSGIKRTKNSKSTPEVQVDKVKKSTSPEYYDPLTAWLLSLPTKPFQDKFDKQGNRIEKRWGGVADKKDVDPWILNKIEDPFGKNKKITENIKRIKKLL